MSENWINDPRLAHIDHTKLTLLNQLAEQGRKKNLTELMPFFLNAMQNNAQNGLHFSNQETKALLEVLKEGKTPAEIKRLEKIMSLMQNLHL